MTFALFFFSILFAAQPDAEQELRTGIALTRSSHFQEAIPHFLAARGRVSANFTLEFNLALCYIGMRQYPLAIPILKNLEAGRMRSDVENLLAQAYIGNGQPREGLLALKKAVALTPANEKLYAFVSDVCLERGYNTLGIEIADMGLHNIPQSQRLLYQRGLFESRLEQIDSANRDFEAARQIAPDSGLGYISAVQERLLSGRISDAVEVAREGIRKGHEHYMLLTMLGEALLRSGAMPGTPEWSEAQSALEKAISQRPDYSSALLGLGKMELMQNRLAQAIAHLEAARQFDPNDPAVYPSLAAAYRRAGNPEKAKTALAALANLNREQAARIASAPGDHAGVASAPPVPITAHTPRP